MTVHQYILQCPVILYAGRLGLDQVMQMCSLGSKLMMSLVNDSLKFPSNDGIAKATHIFSAKNIRILYIESAKAVNEMTLNELVKLTTL